LLGGMMEVPSTQWAARVTEAEAQAPLAAEWRKLKGVVEHTFTHFHLELTVWTTEKVIDGELRDDGDYRWTKREDLDGEALPTVMRKVVAHVLEE
jgi:A/G-specific adenine glycosylase